MAIKKKNSTGFMESILGKNWIAIITLLLALGAKTFSSTNWFITTYADKPYVDERFNSSIKFTQEKYDEAMRAIDVSTERAIAHSDKNKADMLTEIREVGTQVKEMKEWLRERVDERRAERRSSQ